MGNALRFLYGKCCKPTTDDESLRPHGVSAATAGVPALAHDLFNFDITSQVPEGLGRYVVSSRKTQANWYQILEAWKQAKPPPRTAEEASRLVTEILKRHHYQNADVEGLLSFYGLPLPHTLVDLFTEAPLSLPEGVLFEFQTLPVDPRAVVDGDSITVYVSTSDPVVSSSVPREVNVAAVQRAKAREKKDYRKADELHQKIIDSGYRVLNIQSEEVLARKIRIRLRGIDAPESQMPFGKEAQEELLKIVLEGISLWRRSVRAMRRRFILQWDFCSGGNAKESVERSFDVKISGKKRRERSVLACGLLQIQRNHGTGEETGV
ncbi:unnamed protein product [Arabis nemorensis]|uniref:Uncharacterized protein n=1 Tax=Arabis nemorensis TaxID=586526 RepID=A0A565BMR8_9BRAS|nr:unnamed protein product [Arabis nemorensis]